MKGLPAESARSLYAGNADAEPTGRFPGRSFLGSQAQDLRGSDSPRRDELGYLSLDQQTSNLFYRVISTRHAERRSTVITTNTIFPEWGNILFNTTIAAAIADRLVENSEVFLLGGPTWRNPKNGQTAPQH